MLLKYWKVKLRLTSTCCLLVLIVPGLMGGAGSGLLVLVDYPTRGDWDEATLASSWQKEWMTPLWHRSDVGVDSAHSVAYQDRLVHSAAASGRCGERTEVETGKTSGGVPQESTTESWAEGRRNPVTTITICPPLSSDLRMAHSGLVLVLLLSQMFTEALTDVGRCRLVGSLCDLHHTCCTVWGRPGFNVSDRCCICSLGSASEVKCCIGIK